MLKWCWHAAGYSQLHKRSPQSDPNHVHASLLHWIYSFGHGEDMFIQEGGFGWRWRAAKRSPRLTEILSLGLVAYSDWTTFHNWHLHLHSPPLLGPTRIYSWTFKLKVCTPPTRFGKVGKVNSFSIYSAVCSSYHSTARLTTGRVDHSTYHWTLFDRRGSACDHIGI